MAPTSLLPVHDARILIVDDEPATTELFTRMLGRWGFRDVTATTKSGEVAALCAETEPDLILLDLHMPHPDGFALLTQLRPWMVSLTPPAILALTGDTDSDTKRRALAGGARDFLTKPFDPEEVRLRVTNLLHTRRLQCHLRKHGELLETQVEERTSRLDEARLEILARLAIAAEYRDDETGQHTKRVGRTSSQLADLLALPERDAHRVGLAAPLHDIGKIGIPDAVLLKPGTLDDDERRVMKTHVELGTEILGGSRSSLLRTAEEIALYHHERWDGDGYLAGLSGERIPLSARIVAVADVFDALTHDRPYKTGWPIERAVEEIFKQRGTQFDPDVVDAFMRLDHERLLSRVRSLAGEDGEAPAPVLEVVQTQPADPAARPTPSTDSEGVPLSEATEALGVSASTLRRWADRGRIETRRTPGGHRRFPLAEIRRLNAARAGAGTPEVQRAAPPTRPLPTLGPLLAAHRDEVARQSARSLYGSRTGWFASDSARTGLESWLKAVSASCLNGDYDLALEASNRFMRKADLAGASLLERHAFLERFGELMARRLGRAGGTSHTDIVAFRRLFAVMRQSVLEGANDASDSPTAFASAGAGVR